jgi:hypothetical protein
MSVCHFGEWWSAIWHSTEWVTALFHSTVWRTSVCEVKMKVGVIASAYRSSRVHTNICSHTGPAGCNCGRAPLCSLTDKMNLLDKSICR